jgi:hypothetical protein
MSKKAPRRQHVLVPAWLVTVVGVASLVLLTEAGFQVMGSSLFSLLGRVVGLSAPQSRMAALGPTPAADRADLLYLSYLDSLARDGRGLPWVGPGEGAITLPQLLLDRAGIGREKAAAWGLYPDDEPDHGPLNGLFRELHRRGQIALPMQGASLWDHVRDREIHPGYLVFGRTGREPRADHIDFCGVMTIVNWLQPGHSALIYRDPASRRLEHTSVASMPTIAYYGSGRIGDNLAVTYMQHFRLADHRGEEPLYPR